MTRINIRKTLQTDLQTNSNSFIRTIFVRKSEQINWKKNYIKLSILKLLELGFDLKEK